MIKPEDFLIRCIKNNMSGLEGAIKCIDVKPPLTEIDADSFDAGRIYGMRIALGMLTANLRLYESYQRGELPPELLDG